VPNLSGRLVLLVEDEPIILLDIKQHLEDAGASVLVARRLQEALRLAEQQGLSAGLLDYRLGNDDSSPVCRRLNERKIPFVVYSGYDNVDEACRSGEIMTKPADTRALVEAVARLLC
jgi:DNA-binding response OmpR family regulator